MGHMGLEGSSFLRWSLGLKILTPLNGAIAPLITRLILARDR